jgi:hypothetical protein
MTATLTHRARYRTLADAVGRNQQTGSLPGPVRLAARLVHWRLPWYLDEPETVARLAATGRTLLAAASATLVGIAALLVSVRLPALSALALAGVTALLVLRVQRLVVRWTMASRRPVAASAVGRLVCLVFSGLLLTPFVLAVAATGLFVTAEPEAMVLRAFGTLALGAAVTMPLATVHASTTMPSPRRLAAEAQAAQRAGNEAVSPARLWIVPSSRTRPPAAETLTRRLAYWLAVAGGMSPVNTRRYPQLWSGFGARGSLVVAAGAIAAGGGWGLAAQTADVAPFVAPAVGLVWAGICVLGLAGVLHLDAAPRRPAGPGGASRFLALVVCLFLGASTALACLGATGLAATAFPGGETSAAAWLLAAAIGVLMMFLFLLPLLRPRVHAAGRRLYLRHLNLVLRAREESL